MYIYVYIYMYIYIYIYIYINAWYKGPIINERGGGVGLQSMVYVGCVCVCICICVFFVGLTWHGGIV